MIEKLKSIVQEYLRLSELAIDPETLGNQQESIKINKQISDMQEKYELAKEYLNYHGQLEEAKEILNAESDEDMLEIAKEQKKESEAKLEELEQQIKIALLWITTFPKIQLNVHVKSSSSINSYNIFLDTLFQQEESSSYFNFEQNMLFLKFKTS